jgi:acyl-CoA synthetase (AMP-forming)/AMP-acid ligase II
VPADLWKTSRAFLGAGRLHSPYGATEALPVSTVSADEIDAASTRGACVGRPVRGMDVRIIAISDRPIATLATDSALPNGAVGEIIVRGPVVTRKYDGLPEATAASKIADSDPASGIWHRMGDCGTLDDSGRLWFLGRKAERVETPGGTLFTEPCEQVFRAHPRARRCALIGVVAGPALVAETTVTGNSDAINLAAELRTLALGQAHTSAIGTFYFRAHLPVDVRHNAKIHRLALAKWAARAKAYRAA